MTISNAILVFEEGDQVLHRFCPEAEAREYLENAQGKMRGGAMFAADNIEAEFVLLVSSDLRDRVDAAKTRMKSQMRVRDALDRHGVPRDQDLRASIFNAFGDLMKGATA